jgi:hypothetical protein
LQDVSLNFVQGAQKSRAEFVCTANGLFEGFGIEHSGTEQHEDILAGEVDVCAECGGKHVADVDHPNRPIPLDNQGKNGGTEGVAEHD